MSTPGFSDFFRQDIDPLSLPAMGSLLRARDVLSAFIALFRGGEDEVFVRLLILREIASRADAPRWAPSELQNHFAYVNSVKLDTVLKRLREFGLLVWHSDEQLYQLSEAGRVAVAGLATLLNFADADAELGYLTAQVAAGQSVGKLSPEALQHLLARLNELHQAFEDALESQSEYQIRKAQSRLESVWRWVEKGTEVMRAILADDTLDLATLNQAQAIAYAQSRMLRLTGVFQRRLHELQSQRVHLGQSGLTSTNVADWLRSRSQEDLARLSTALLAYHPEPVFLTSAEMLDITEYELLEREREAEVAATWHAACAAPAADAQTVERLLAAESLLEDLQRFGLREEPVPLAESVLADRYEDTAYRLSLLALLGDADAALDDSVVAEIVRQPLVLETDGEVELLDHPQVASLSRGHLKPQKS